MTENPMATSRAFAGVLVAGALLAPIGAGAASPAAPTPGEPAAAADAVLTRAIVQSIVEQEGGRRIHIHLKVAPGAKLPFTTLTFRVPDRQMIAGLAQGQSVKFSARRIDGENTLTAIRAVPPCVRFQPCD
jgi:Cu/Ag efflux protein CusF